MFGQKNLDSILSSFHKIIFDLKDLVEHHDKNISEKKEEISTLSTEINNHDAEKVSALNVLKNLENLVKGN